MKRLVLAALFSIIIVSPVNAQSTLALQEKCAEAAKEFFFLKRQSYNIPKSLPNEQKSFVDEKGFGTIDFTPHYSTKHDKCYVRIEYSFYEFDWKTSDQISITIHNVFENSMVALISEYLHKKEDKSYDGNDFIICRVGNNKCNSRYEFQSLIRTYMEE